MAPKISVSRPNSRPWLGQGVEKGLEQGIVDCQQMAFFLDPRLVTHMRRHFPRGREGNSSAL